MKLPDDRLPEERDPQYEELITLLQQANLNPMLVDPTERAQLLARARGRLFQTDPERSTPEDMPVLEVSELASFPGKPKALADKQHRGRRLIHLVNGLAAVLAVIALIGSALLLFWYWLPSTGSLGKPITVQTQANGLEATMRVAPGPYFLNEMLAADLTLTNHSQTPYLLEGTWDNPGIPDDHCHLPLKVVMTGGDSPRDTGLERDIASAISCFSSTPGTTQVLPNQTITISQYLALTSSGSVTLQMQGTFQTPTLGQDGIIHIVSTTGLLDGHWPSVRISVQAQVPAQRLISLHAQPAQVVVDAPPAARGRLLYLSTYDCVDRNSSQHGGRGYWSKLPGTVIEKPQCGYSVINGTPTYAKFVRWVYVVGAPGYSIVAGTYP